MCGLETSFLPIFYALDFVNDFSDVFIDTCLGRCNSHFCFHLGVQEDLMYAMHVMLDAES